MAGKASADAAARKLDRAHTLIAEAMSYVDYEDYELGRLESERRSEARRQAAGLAQPAP